MGSALQNAGLLAFVAVIFLLSSKFQTRDAALPKLTLKRIKKVNKNGPYVGILTTTSDELEPLLSKALKSELTYAFNYPYLDCDGKRFHIARIKKNKVIFAMTGKGMLLFRSSWSACLIDVRAILHYGTAANANPSHNTGDVAIPGSWAHTGLWSWQRHGGGRDEELPLESEGHFTRQIGSLNFSDFIHHHSGGGGGGGGDEEGCDEGDEGDEDEEDNFLNSVWFQPEEIFSIHRTAESSDKVFWVAVNHVFMELAKKLAEDIKLKGCINNSTCLPNRPKVAVVEKGSSSNQCFKNRTGN